MSEKNDKKFGKLYLESYKRAIVAEVEGEVDGAKIVIARHGLSGSAVQRWINKYGSPEFLAKRKNRRSPAEKNSIIWEIISKRSTLGEAQLRYNIRRDTLTWWIREYKKAQPELPDELKDSTIINQDSEWSELQKELEMARLKIRALEIVVDIASDQFKVDIRKKFGAKQ